MDVEPDQKANGQRLLANKPDDDSSEGEADEFGEDETAEEFVQMVARKTIEEMEGPRTIFRAWTPEVATKALQTFENVTIGRNSAQAQSLARRSTVQWVVQGVVLLAIIGALVYLSAAQRLEAAGATALGTLAGYLMGRRGA